jgi:hypothetical protein
MRPFSSSVIVSLLLVSLFLLVPLTAPSRAADPVAVRSLDGSGNNLAHPDWGQLGKPYLRVAPANYADGIKTMVTGPPARYTSNRIFNDLGQNIFSENHISQWGWLWGQFLDHTFGLRDETPAESAPIAFSAADPLERFTNDTGVIDFARTPAAPGTGVTTTRQQINTVSSYIDAFAVYGGTNARLDWLRRGLLDGDPTNNSASLLLPGGYLPRLDARGDPGAAPAMDLFGAQVISPDSAVVAGDVRANENIALTAVHTLLAREHNRIVAALPNTLSAEDKFQIARRVVGAEEQYITYNEFLPALGVDLPAYTGYNPTVNATLANEFATVGYRAHSMIHGEMEPVAPASSYSQAQLDAFTAQGIVVTHQGSDVKLTIPLNVTFGNPELLTQVGEGPLLQGLANERQYRNDEQIDDTLRSILFQTPKPGALDPSVCAEPAVNPNCFQNVQDLGAIDIQRGRDHGMPTYNQLRVAYGLPAKTSYTAITGESTAAFPNDPLINQADPINDPNILDFTKLLDENGNPIDPGSDAAIDSVVTGIRRTTIAARLKAIYGAGNTNKVEAFVGMLCEPHVQGTEFGELQLAIWKKQFQALRDGDRFFYGNDPYLATIKALYGIDYQQTLANLIHVDAGVTTQADVFQVPAEVTPPPPPPPPPVPGLVAAYSFDENAGTTIADASGHGNTGTVSNTTWSSTGHSGSALSFNGTNSWVTVPDSASLDLTSGMTLEAWVKPTQSGGWQTALIKEDAPQTELSYGLYASTDSGQPSAHVLVGAPPDTFQRATTSTPAGAWTHIAATYDGTTLRVYVNGVQEASKPLSGPITTSNDPLRIGGNNIWGEWFSGLIDDIRIYNHALTTTEIQTDMTTPVH